MMVNLRPRRPHFPEGDLVPRRGLAFVAVTSASIAGLAVAASAGLATLAASAIWHLGGHGGHARGAAVLLLAALGYASITAGLDGLFSHLARGDRPAVSLTELRAEFVLASLGVGVAAFWAIDPW